MRVHRQPTTHLNRARLGRGNRGAHCAHSERIPFTPARKVLIGLAALGVAAAFVIVPLTASSSASTVPLQGSYDGAANTSGASSFASETGTTTSIYSDYAAGQNESWTDWNNTIDWLIPQLKGKLGSSRLELSVPLASGGYSSQAAAMAAFAANPATFDSNMTSLAQTLVSNGFSNTIIRLMWEPQELGLYSNDDLTSAGNYAALFRDAHTAMASVSGASFQWAWYWEANFDSNTNNAAYPGSAYVDYITNDFYDQSWVTTCGIPYNGTAFTATQENCVWNAVNGYSATLKNLTDFASQEGKPIGIGEWGVISRSDDHGGNDDPTFISNYVSWMKSSNVAWASYFNFNDDGLNSTLSDFPNSLAAYKSALAGSGGSSTSSAPSPAPTTTTTPPPAPTTTTTAPAPTTTTTAPAPTTTTTPSPPASTTTTTPPAPHTTPTTVPTGTTTTVPTTTTTTPPTPAASSGPPPGSITVTTLGASASSAAVGDESALEFKVTVTPPVNENVGVYGDGGLFKLCSVTITTDDGSGTCAMTDNELGPGLYLAGAITVSGADYMGSFSNPVPFSVTTGELAGSDVATRAVTRQAPQQPRRPHHRSGSRRSNRHL